MNTYDTSSWQEFEEKLEADIAMIGPTQSALYVSPPLFRGQSSSTWELETTWERYRPKQGSGVEDYYRRMLVERAQIESVTGQRWDIPTDTEFSEMLKKQECPTLPGLPGYEFWAYLRHFRFPSPLLDWSRSRYVAAFFAFNSAKCQDGDDRVAIFVYIEYVGQAKRRNPGMPYVSTTGPHVRTHMRHVLQQSDYTICLADCGGQWHFENYQAAFSVAGQREVLWKYTIPASERLKVLSILDRFNLNAFSLFASEEGLLDSIANRELMFKPRF
jgi:hypothetical protein